jgi:acetyl-CoA C-acetyltransferase
MDETRIPVLIGGGQIVQRDAEPETALEPLALMREAVLRAAEDASLPRSALQEADLVAVVNILSWQVANAPGALAAELGARPRALWYSSWGGNTPQWLVNEIASQIAAGKISFAVLAGAEALATMQRAGRKGVVLQWQAGQAPGFEEPEMMGSLRPGGNDHEAAHGLTLPIAVYPLFENALRHHYGWTIEQHRRELGRLCARMSAVAARNPYAWFPIERTAEEIAAVAPENRMVCFPYTKYMNAIIEVDQGAALLLTSAARARALGVPEDRWVYLWGCADAQDHWYVSERVHYFGSPAIQVAAEHAFRMAGWSVGDIAFFDLYSCFPCAVQIARDALDVPRDDPRPLTVTGGLPYAGGPGNNYVTHAIATMLRVLREHPGKRGLVSGVGWYLTKHSIGLYSTERPPRPFVREDPATYQERIDAMPRPELVQHAEGRGTVETYTVVHGRDGSPLRAIVVGRLEDGRRFLANSEGDRELLARWEVEEAIGCTGWVCSDGERNRFEVR